MKRVAVDRRAVVFYVFALVSLLLLIPCPAHFHYVGVIVAVAYVVLGTFSWLDALMRSRSGNRKRG